MRQAICLFIMLAAPTVCFSKTIHVPADYFFIQEAINAASVGDTVLVAPGTYAENIDFIGKAITVKSELGPAVTIINGNHTGSVVTCQSNEGSDSVLEGFIITNGHGSLDGGGMFNHSSSPTVNNCIFRENPNVDGDGGGMYNWYSSPLVTDCTFSLNRADDGGGMYNEFSSPTVNNCTFTENEAFQGSGGGMANYHSSPTVTDCTFSGNWAEEVSGGGMFNFESDPMVSYCTFTGNSAIYWYGGGMFNWNSSPTIASCMFTGNGADSKGGGMFNDFSHPVVIDCTFSDNSVTGYWGSKGAGMYNQDSNPTIANCTFTGNSTGDSGDADGGGMYNWYSNPLVTSCTFSGNWAYSRGGGIYCAYSSPSITNTVLWGNIALYGPEIYGTPTSTPTVNYCDVKGGWLGTGNIDADPLFVNTGYWDDNGTPGNPKDDVWVNGDYHLTFNSPCRGSGDNTAPGLPDYDYEGDPRIAHGAVDMGIDEFYTHLYYTGDAIPSGSIELKFIDLPGTAPVGFWGGSAILDVPISTQYGDWWNQWWLDFSYPIAGPIILVPIPQDGVEILSGKLPRTPGPYAIYFQGMIGDSLTNLCTLKVK